MREQSSPAPTSTEERPTRRSDPSGTAAGLGASATAIELSTEYCGWCPGADWHLEQRQVAEDLDVIAVMLKRIHVAFDRLIVVPLRPVQQPEHAKE